MTGSLAEPLQTASSLVPVAAHGLAGSMVELERGPYSPFGWFQLVAGCQEHGLLGMVAAAAQRGDLALTSAQLEELAVLENEAAGLALLLEQRAVRLAALLAAAGVGHRLLGGPARARLGYRQPGLRGFTTAIMLVEPQGMQVTAAPRGVLLKTSVRTAQGRLIGLSDLADPPTLLAMGGYSVATASAEEHLVLACLDVAAAGERAAATPDHLLLIQRDVAELALSPAVDHARVQHTAEAWGVVEQVAAGLVAVWQLFQLADRTRLSVWAHRMLNAPVGRTSPMPTRPTPVRQPERRPVTPGGRLGRMVHKLAPGGSSARTTRRVR